MGEILIAGGRLIDPAAGVDGPFDVLIRDGRVAAVERPSVLQAQERVDATGCVVAPGLIDVHVHLREPGQTWKETITTGTAAAAAGGFTSVVAMPNTVPVTDTVERMRWVMDAARGPLTRVFCMPAATVGSMGERLTEMEALADAGAVGFTDDGKPVLDERLMREALLRAGRMDRVISQHAEDTRISPSSGVNAGPVAFRMGLRGMTIEVEVSIVERDIALVREIAAKEGVRARLHVQHISTAMAVEAVRRAKAEGLEVTCEAAPHHFALNETALGEFDTHSKMNPPLRAEADREAVLAGLRDGTVDCIATDHAPHARHEKEVEFELAPNGITGLETALGLALQVLPVARVVEVMSAAPARVAGLKLAGSLAVGCWGDVTVFAPEVECVFRAAETRSRSKNTPFDGTRMRGRVRATVVGGRVVYS